LKNKYYSGFFQQLMKIINDYFSKLFTPGNPVKCGGYKYEDGTKYIGDWNQKGQRHGMGHMLLKGIFFQTK
jgi:hypothetical protein